ncbi:hypothetical protein M404DRAFT_1001496, partial [Pisolithus tinctorius Marx 270]
MLLYCSVWPLNGVLAVEGKSVSDCQLRTHGAKYYEKVTAPGSELGYTGENEQQSFLRRETQPVIRSRDTEFRSTKEKIT